MGKKKPPRHHVRPVKAVGVLEKRFVSVIPTSRPLTPTRIHPCVVKMDLRKGSLSSLDRYLAQEGGIPDREIAIELRKLIKGSRARTAYRLIVVEHPDQPKDKGGRPRTGKRRPTRVELAVVQDLRALDGPGVRTAAVAAVADKYGIKPATVYKYEEKVRTFEEASRHEVEQQEATAAETAAFLERRQRYLDEVSKKNGEKES